MSIAQLKSINERKLKTRAEAYVRITQNTRLGREHAWMAGRQNAVRELKDFIATKTDKGHVTLCDVIQWLEEQP